jgi:hypothetical protein
MRGQIVFPCWPFHEQFHTDLATVHEYKCSKYTESTVAVTYVRPLHGNQFTKQHLVKVDLDMPMDSGRPWRVVPDRGHSCDGGCYIPQVRRAPCVHALAALRNLHPGHVAAPGVKLGPHELEDKRAQEAAAYTRALRSMTADFYQVDFLLEGLKPLVTSQLAFVPNVADLRMGPTLKPIRDVPAPSPIRFSGAGRPAGAERRIPSQGETELKEAAGARVKRARTRKNTCSACKARGLPGLSHTKRSLRCPLNRHILLLNSSSGASNSRGKVAVTAEESEAETMREEDFNDSSAEGSDSDEGNCA